MAGKFFGDAGQVGCGGAFYSGVTTGSGFEQASFLTQAQTAKLEKIDLQTHFVIKR